MTPRVNFKFLPYDVQNKSFNTLKPFWYSATTEIGARIIQEQNHSYNWFVDKHPQFQKLRQAMDILELRPNSWFKDYVSNEWP